MSWFDHDDGPYDSPRVPGLKIRKGLQRPANETPYPSWYIHYESVGDYFVDWLANSRDSGIYKMENAATFEDAFKGMFKIGGAQYDYAESGYDHYITTARSIRDGVNASNDNALEKLDQLWKDGKLEVNGVRSSKQSSDSSTTSAVSTQSNNGCMAFDPSALGSVVVAGSIGTDYVKLPSGITVSQDEIARAYDESSDLPYSHRLAIIGSGAAPRTDDPTLSDDHGHAHDEHFAGDGHDHDHGPVAGAGITSRTVIQGSDAQKALKKVWDSPATGEGSWGDHPTRVRRLLLELFGNDPGNVFTYGGHWPQADLAIDYMVPPSGEHGDSVAAFLVENSDLLGLEMIMWGGKIMTFNVPYQTSDYSAPVGVWTAVGDRGIADNRGGGVTANHGDHVHISFKSGFTLSKDAELRTTGDGGKTDGVDTTKYTGLQDFGGRVGQVDGGFKGGVSSKPSDSSNVTAVCGCGYWEPDEDAIPNMPSYRDFANDELVAGGFTEWEDFVALYLNPDEIQEDFAIGSDAAQSIAKWREERQQNVLLRNISRGRMFVSLSGIALALFSAMLSLLYVFDRVVPGSPNVISKLTGGRVVSVGWLDYAAPSTSGKAGKTKVRYLTDINIFVWVSVLGLMSTFLISGIGYDWLARLVQGVVTFFNWLGSLF